MIAEKKACMNLFFPYKNSRKKMTIFEVLSIKGFRTKKTSFKENAKIEP